MNCFGVFYVTIYSFYLATRMKSSHSPQNNGYNTYIAVRFLPSLRDILYHTNANAAASNIIGKLMNIAPGLKIATIIAGMTYASITFLLNIVPPLFRRYVPCCLILFDRFCGFGWRCCCGAMSFQIFTPCTLHSIFHKKQKQCGEPCAGDYRRQQTADFFAAVASFDENMQKKQAYSYKYKFIHSSSFIPLGVYLPPDTIRLILTARLL